MSDYKIEKNVPIPYIVRKYGGKYPWEEMEIGDSFVIENPNLNARGYTQSYIGQPNIRYAPKRFSQHVQKDKSARVWRIE